MIRIVLLFGLLGAVMGAVVMGFAYGFGMHFTGLRAAVTLCSGAMLGGLATTGRVLLFDGFDFETDSARALWGLGILAVACGAILGVVAP